MRIERFVKFFKQNIVLISILLVAAVLRLYQLNTVPPSASIDEASIGYNAYSVLHTGGDEFGTFPFVYQRGFDDFRRSTYLFLAIPSIGIFGLQPLAVRLPAVLLALLTVLAVYRIVELLFIKKSSFSYAVALLSALLVAIAPWSIYLSRMGHESNAYLSFFVFGILFFLEGLTDVKKLFLAAIFFTLATISYYPGQIVMPLMAVGLGIIFRKELAQRIFATKKILFLFVAYLILIIPILWLVFSPAAISRFAGVSTFSPQSHPDLFAQRVQAWNSSVKEHNIIGMIFYNRRLYPVQVFFDGYISHFNPLWLFTNPDNGPFKAPQSGLLYLWEFPFILIGIICFFKSKQVSGKGKLLMLLWVLLAPVPAAIATQAPHANRTYLSVIPWQIFAALGIAYLVSSYQKIRLILISLISLIALYSVGQFLYNYFVLFPQQQSHAYSYALSKAIPYVLSKEKNYKHVVFSNTDSLYQSYMVFLFDARFNPSLYQKLGGTGSGGFAETHSFGKYAFRPINWSKDQESTNVLFIGNTSDFPIAIGGKTFTDKNGDGSITVIAR